MYLNFNNATLIYSSFNDKLLYLHLFLSSGSTARYRNESEKKISTSFCIFKVGFGFNSCIQNCSGLKL